MYEILKIWKAENFVVSLFSVLVITIDKLFKVKRLDPIISKMLSSFVKFNT